ncbi:MAG: hypothetical protein R3D55_11305 [Chloroflexota bacterium]
MTTDSATMKLKENNTETPFLLRVIWFFVFGWELTVSGFWWLMLNASIIGLPLGLWMIDRVPQVLTPEGAAWGGGDGYGRRPFPIPPRLQRPLPHPGCLLCAVWLVV